MNVQRKSAAPFRRRKHAALVLTRAQTPKNASSSPSPSSSSSSSSQKQSVSRLTAVSDEVSTLIHRTNTAFSNVVRFATTSVGSRTRMHFPNGEDPPWDDDMYCLLSEDDEDDYDFAGAFPNDVQLAAASFDEDDTTMLESYDDSDENLPETKRRRTASSSKKTSTPLPASMQMEADLAAIDRMLEEQTSVGSVFQTTITGMSSSTGGAVANAAESLTGRMGKTAAGWRSNAVLNILKVTGPLPPSGYSLTGGELPRDPNTGKLPTEKERDFWRELPMSGWDKCLFIWNRPYFARVRMIGAGVSWSFRLPMLTTFVAATLPQLSMAGLPAMVAALGASFSSVLSLLPFLAGFVVLGKQIIKNGATLIPRIIEVGVILWVLWGVNRLVTGTLAQLQAQSLIPKRVANLVLNASELIVLLVAAIVMLTALGLQVSNWIMPASIALLYCFRDVGQNFAAGMFLFASQPFKSGDRVAIPFTNAALTSLGSAGGVAALPMPAESGALALPSTSPVVATAATSSSVSPSAAQLASADSKKENDRKEEKPMARLDPLSSLFDGSKGKAKASESTKGNGKGQSADASTAPSKSSSSPSSPLSSSLSPSSSSSSSSSPPPPSSPAVALQTIDMDDVMYKGDLPTDNDAVPPLPRGWLEGICEAVDLRYTILRHGRRKLMVPNNAFITREFMVVEPLMRPLEYDLDDEDAHFPSDDDPSSSSSRGGADDPSSLSSGKNAASERPRGRKKSGVRRKKGGTTKITMKHKITAAMKNVTMKNVMDAGENKEMQRRRLRERQQRERDEQE
ncbi:plasma membrane iron permease [Pycnococcus provasolii]